MTSQTPARPVGADRAIGLGLVLGAGIAFAFALVISLFPAWVFTDVGPRVVLYLLVALLRCLDATYGRLVAGPSGPTELLAGWRERSATLGRRVRVDLGADDVVGTAVDVTADGHLVVETLEGERRVLAVGDVVHLRPDAGGQASAAGDSTSS